MGGDGRERVARAFVEAFGQNDLMVLRQLLAEGFVGHVTTDDGGSRAVDTAGYLASVEQMDVPTANLELAVPNVTLVGDDAVLVMVEVHAARHGRTLHNFSGQLLRVVDGRIEELWMVEALPAESDAFWSA